MEYSTTEQVAQTVYEELREHLADDAINAVGYFNDETQEFTHISSDLEQRYEETVFLDILENAFLDVWGGYQSGENV